VSDASLYLFVVGPLLFMSLTALGIGTLIFWLVLLLAKDRMILWLGVTGFVLVLLGMLAGMSMNFVAGLAYVNG